MKKIYKIANITLIFILMLFFGRVEAGYTANSVLRIPIDQEFTLERAKKSYDFFKYEQEKRIVAIKGVGMLLEEAKLYFNQTGQKLLVCLGGGTNVWDHYIPEIINIKTEITGFADFTVSSEESGARLGKAGIEVLDLDKVKSIDILIDGVDEVTKNGIGIKGGGGCVLLEKKAIIIAKKIWISAESKKLVDTLGKFWLPLDIKEDKKEAVEAKLTELGAAGFKIKTDSKGQTFRPDNGPDRIILNADFSGNMINDPVSLAASLEVMKDEGLILEHGICFTDTRPDILLIGMLGAPENVQMFYPKTNGIQKLASEKSAGWDPEWGEPSEEAMNIARTYLENWDNIKTEEAVTVKFFWHSLRSDEGSVKKIDIMMDTDKLCDIFKAIAKLNFDFASSMFVSTEHTSHFAITRILHKDGDKPYITALIDRGIELIDAKSNIKCVNKTFKIKYDYRQSIEVIFSHFQHSAGWLNNLKHAASLINNYYLYNIKGGPAALKNTAVQRYVFRTTLTQRPEIAGFLSKESLAWLNSSKTDNRLPQPVHASIPINNVIWKDNDLYGEVTLGYDLHGKHYDSIWNYLYEFMPEGIYKILGKRHSIKAFMVTAEGQKIDLNDMMEVRLRENSNITIILSKDDLLDKETMEIVMRSLIEAFQSGNSALRIGDNLEKVRESLKRQKKLSETLVGTIQNMSRDCL